MFEEYLRASPMTSRRQTSSRSGGKIIVNMMLDVSTIVFRTTFTQFWNLF